jgi:hypothetical protein
VLLLLHGGDKTHEYMDKTKPLDSRACSRIIIVVPLIVIVCIGNKCNGRYCSVAVYKQQHIELELRVWREEFETE